MSFARSALSLSLSVLVTGLLSPAQDPQAPSASNQKYKLTIVENASTSKRVKKGRVSSQAVVKLTDENDRPMPAIAVIFTIPQLTGTGATFANGGFTSMATTDASGVATSGTYTSSAGNFNISATASTPGGATTTSVPVTITAAAAGAAGISTGVLIAIIAAVGGAAGAGIALANGGKGSSSGGGGGTTAAGPTGSISGPGSPTLNPPK